jgi:hypothetical protein
VNITLEAQWKADGPVTFTSYSQLLRWLVDNARSASTGGPKPTLLNLYLGSRNRDGTVSPSTLYRVNERLRYKITAEDLGAVFDLLRRYKSVAHYFAEIEPDWKVVETIPFMDNSVEEVQQDKRGNRRRVMTKPPSGDACY